MKALWSRFDTWLMALKQRERVLVVAGSAVLLVFLSFQLALDPAYARQRALRAAMQEQRMQMAAIAAELMQMDIAARRDPDRELRERLRTLQEDSAVLRSSLRGTQQGLVAPEQMGPLLRQMVQGHGQLRLVSLKTLAPQGSVDGNFPPFSAPSSAAAPVLATPSVSVSPLGAISVSTPVAGFKTTAAAAPAPAASAAPMAPLLYRHGVQLVLQGGYLDMIGYMEALEALPSRLFWGDAVLDAQLSPTARLTLTLYTLSLEPKWIAL